MQPTFPHLTQHAPFHYMKLRNLSLIASEESITMCFVNCCGAVAKVWDPTQVIRVRLLCDRLLHHGDNRGRHSADHSLLPHVHLCVPVL